MKFYTSYYDNAVNLPKQNSFLISISGGIDKAIQDQINSWNTKLAPSWSIYQQYKESQDWQRYVERYQLEILNTISFAEYYHMLSATEYDNIIFLCYERPDEFCHRHIIAETIQQQCNIVVDEYGFEGSERHNFRISKAP